MLSSSTPSEQQVLQPPEHLHRCQTLSCRLAWQSILYGCVGRHGGKRCYWPKRFRLGCRKACYYRRVVRALLLRAGVGDGAAVAGGALRADRLPGAAAAARLAARAHGHAARAHPGLRAAALRAAGRPNRCLHRIWMLMLTASRRLNPVIDPLLTRYTVPLLLLP